MYCIGCHVNWRIWVLVLRLYYCTLCYVQHHTGTAFCYCFCLLIDFVVVLVLCPMICHFMYAAVAVLLCSGQISLCGKIKLILSYWDCIGILYMSEIVWIFGIHLWVRMLRALVFYCWSSECRFAAVFSVFHHSADLYACFLSFQFIAHLSVSTDPRSVFSPPEYQSHKGSLSQLYAGSALFTPSCCLRIVFSLLIHSSNVFFFYVL